MYNYTFKELFIKIKKIKFDYYGRIIIIICANQNENLPRDV